LKNRVSRAVGWSAADQIVRQGLMFGVSVTMARMVAPEAYGTIALLSLFTSIATVFVDGGLSSALIQKKGVTHTDESTVFWFNVTIGLSMALALFFSAPWIANFYGVPVLKTITQLYSFQFLLGACNAVQNTLFIKKIDFKTPLKINTASTVISAVIGIYMAWKGYGIWALVAQSMSSSILQTIILWAISRWRPAFTFSRQSFNELFGFGGFLFLSWILDAAYLKFYTLLIGKWYGIHDLGIYNRADSTKQLPAGVLSGILARVAFPLFSEANDDPVRLRNGLKLSIRGVMFINAPMMLGIASVAGPLVLTLFGDAWSAAVPLLQILALGAVLRPLQVLNLSVLQAMGHSRLFLKIEILKKTVGTILIILGSRWGVEGMAWAVVVSGVFSFVFNSYHSGKLLDFGALKQMREVISTIICAVLMAAAVTAASTIFQWLPIFQLLVLVSIGVSVYLAAAKIFKVKELDESIRFVRLKFQEFRSPTR